jgi:UDP-sulfoquinovose synthase
LRVLVLGADGYLGWPTALRLSAAGHHVGISDSFARRSWDLELGIDTLVPIHGLDQRAARWAELSGQSLPTYIGDLCDPGFVHSMVRDFEPDTIVHYGEQRSAPYSMIDQQHAVFTQVNNLTGTLNLLYAIAEINRDIHLVKLGTMGEYGTPNIDIEEGWLVVTHRGRTDRVLYPKRPGSFYHLSKVHDSHNIEFGCRIWGLRATDLNQGVVYGQITEETALDPVLATRLDYDHVFGTVLNRFAVQAVAGHPLTVYGAGGQTRGVINLLDTVECVRLAVENPPPAGEFQVFNQFTQQLSVNQIADAVTSACPWECAVVSVDNPRVEADQHYYRAANSGLLDLGLAPHLLDEDVVTSLLEIADRHRERIQLDTIPPSVQWRATSSEVAAPIFVEPTKS